MSNQYESGLETNSKELKSNNVDNEEKVSLGGFLKRMYLIAYACFKYPFAKGDVYIDFKSGKISLEKSL